MNTATKGRRAPQTCLWAFVPENRPSGLFFFCPDPGGRVRDAVRSGGGGIVTQYGPVKSDTACVSARLGRKNVFCPYGVSRKCRRGKRSYRSSNHTENANKRAREQTEPSHTNSNETKRTFIRVHSRHENSLSAFACFNGIQRFRTAVQTQAFSYSVCLVNRPLFTLCNYFIVKIYNDVTNPSRCFPTGMPRSLAPQIVTFA